MLQKGGQKGVIFRIPRARARARARGDKSGFVLEIIATPLEIEFPRMGQNDPFLTHFLDHFFGRSSSHSRWYLVI